MSLWLSPSYTGLLNDFVKTAFNILLRLLSQYTMQILRYTEISFHSIWRLLSPNKDIQAPSKHHQYNKNFAH